METLDPSVPLPILFGVICVLMLIVIKDEFKKDKHKS
jgi:hypothetical protein